MICYRDMAFCPFWRDCANGAECDRALTPEEEAGAQRWGGDDAPISIYMIEPSCFEPKPEKPNGT